MTLNAVMKKVHQTKRKNIYHPIVLLQVKMILQQNRVEEDAAKDSQLDATLVHMFINKQKKKKKKKNNLFLFYILIILLQINIINTNLKYNNKKNIFNSFIILK